MPTIKQKKAFKAMGENGGIISKAMETAGYAKSITHATEKLTNSDGWKELLEKYLPDNKLARKHQQLLNSERQEIAIKALDLGYKVKSKFPQEPENPESSENIKVLIMTVNNIINGTSSSQSK